MTAWACSKCGRQDVIVAAARPSLDDRYAVGYCPTCAPVPPPVDPREKPRKTPNPSVPLVRADLWDPAAAAERDRRRSDERFLVAYRDGTIKADDPKNRARASALLGRYEAERLARHSS